MKIPMWIWILVTIVGLWVLFRFVVPKYLGWAIQPELLQQADSLLEAERIRQEADSEVISRERQEFRNYVDQTKKSTDSLSAAAYRWKEIADSLYRLRMGTDRPPDGVETPDTPPRLTGDTLRDAQTMARLGEENQALRLSVIAFERRHVQDSMTILRRDDRILQLEKWQDSAVVRMAGMTRLIEDLRDQSECYIAGIKALGRCPSRTVAAIGGAVVAIVASR